MSSELTFYSEAHVQSVFNWDETFVETKELVKEDAELTATIDDAMVKRFHGRVKIGFNLMALQAEHAKDGHGDFTTVELPKLGITDRKFAYRCINVAKLFQKLGGNSSVPSLEQTEIFDLPMPLDTWNRLASPSGQTVVKQLESGEIDPTQAAITKALEEERAKVAAEKQARSAAERKAEDIQTQLSLFQARSQLAQNQIEEKDLQIATLQQEIATLSQPQVQIQEVPVIPPEVTKKLAELQGQAEAIKKQRDELQAHNKRLFKKTEELAAELDEQKDANKARHEQEMYEHKINARVQKFSEDLGRSMVTFLGQLPSPIESQVVSGSNWALLDHAADMAQKIIDAVKQSKISKDAAFLNSEVESNAL